MAFHGMECFIPRKPMDIPQMTMDIPCVFCYGKTIQVKEAYRMEKGPVISHIGLMLRYLDEESIRAVYMIVKALYAMTQELSQGKRPD